MWSLYNRLLVFSYYWRVNSVSFAAEVDIEKFKLFEKYVILLLALFIWSLACTGVYIPNRVILGYDHYIFDEEFVQLPIENNSRTK